MGFHLSPYTATMGLSGLPLQFAVGFVATCAFWLFGYDMSVMGGVITETPFKSVFPEMDDENILGVVIASLELGAMAGALWCLDLGDRLGRRNTVLFGMAWMIVGGALQTSAWSVGQLVAGRILSGIGLGLQVATIPMWQSECSTGKGRGRWVMVEGGLQTCGVASGQWVTYGTYYLKSQAQWRLPVGIQLIPAVIVIIAINFLPESPRWLIKHGMYEEGTEVLCKLRALDKNDPVLVAERDSIVASFEAQKAEAPFSYRELIQGGKTQNFRRVLLGFFMQSAQQLSGINLVSTYANKILGDSFNLEGGMSHLIAAAGGTEYAICSLISVFLVEGIGRRKAFGWTATGMTASFVIIIGLLSGVVKNADGDVVSGRTNQLVAAGFLFVFNTFFGLAWVGGPFLYSAEIAPLRIRSQANAIASAGNWLFCFVVVMIVPPAFANLDWKTYIIFAVFNFCFVVIIYFFLVEAKGRSLEELDVVFAAGGNPVKTEKRLPKDISVSEARRILGLEDADEEKEKGEVRHVERADSQV